MTEIDWGATTVKVYAAEDFWHAAVDPHNEFLEKRMDRREIKAWLAALGSLVGKVPPRLTLAVRETERHGLAGLYSPGRHLLALDPVHGTNLRMLVHEAAHWLTRGDGHGPAFTRTHLDLVTLFFGDVVASGLQTAYDDWEVEVDG